MTGNQSIVITCMAKMVVVRQDVPASYGFGLLIRDIRKAAKFKIHLQFFIRYPHHHSLL